MLRVTVALLWCGLAFTISAEAQTSPSREDDGVVQKILKELVNRPKNRLKQVLKDREYKVFISDDATARVQVRYCDWELEDGSFEGVHSKQNEQRAFHQKDTTYLRIALPDRTIDWAGLGTPILLREHGQRLYFAVFDRETDPERVRIRYFAERHGGLHEIAPQSFPRVIAVQNLWLNDDEKTRVGKLDIRDLQFQGSLTAKMWQQLSSGTEYFEDPDRVPIATLSKFLENEKPKPPRL